MKFVLAAPGNTPNDWLLIQKVVSEAELVGFWGFVLPDHFMGGRLFGGDSTLDTWIALAYLAPLTKRIRLGSLVTPIGLRPPAILAKMVSTLDVLTDGRALLGVGAGSYQSELEAYNSGDVTKALVDRTIEGVELILRLWTEPVVDFDGRFFKAKGAVLEPKPRQKPNPPLIFGGMGRRMFQAAGRLGDICLAPLSEPELTTARDCVKTGVTLRKRRGSVAFATAADALPEAWHVYDTDRYFQKALAAEKQGCEYFVVPFQRNAYFESLYNFAKAVMPSFP